MLITLTGRIDEFCEYTSGMRTIKTSTFKIKDMLQSSESQNSSKEV